MLLLVALAMMAPQSASGARKPPPAPNVDSLHWAAWDSVLSFGDAVPAIRYSFYAYRSLAVPCPEIYLKSDALFSEIVEKMPGSLVAYTDRDPRKLDMYRRLRLGTAKGNPFYWGQRPLDPAAVNDSAIDAQRCSWLDRRMPSPAVLLRAAIPNLSTLEAASLLYTQMRRTGQRDSTLFIIVDSLGHGYMCQDSVLISVQTTLPLEIRLAAISPVLVFNEHSTFYPLLGRDDRESDARLRELVGRLGQPSTPALTLLDRIRLEKIKALAALPTQQSRGWAAIVSCGAVGMYSPVVQRAWASIAADTGEVAVSREQAMVRTTIYWANTLSLRVAELAAAGGNAGDFSEMAARWQGRYLQMCGRTVVVDGVMANPEQLEAWGNLWAEGMFDITFDDIIRTRAGMGSSQALAMAAAMDMVKQPNFRLELDPGERLVADQSWVIGGEGHWQFNLGTWRRIADTVRLRSAPPVLLYSWSKSGEWMGLNADQVQTDADNLTVASHLTETVRLLPAATLRFRSPRSLSCGFGEFMMKLESGEISLRPLPWPAVGLADERPK
ncbi:MAG: hypothetical protein HZB43_11120 [candidate division Zixibacteria bacterium]|nr:hypothetical protein [candidate division Zixibacteria bacterium]